MKNAKKQKAGRAGGRSTVARHGAEHMRTIGKKGAESTWSRYDLMPFALAEYAMVRKSDNKIVAIW